MRFRVLVEVRFLVRSNKPDCETRKTKKLQPSDVPDLGTDHNRLRVNLFNNLSAYQIVTDDARLGLDSHKTVTVDFGLSFALKTQRKRRKFRQQETAKHTSRKKSGALVVSGAAV